MFFKLVMKIQRNVKRDSQIVPELQLLAAPRDSSALPKDLDMHHTTSSLTNRDSSRYDISLQRINAAPPHHYSDPAAEVHFSHGVE